MDFWSRLSSNLTEHWLTLSPPSLLAAGLGWLGKRRGWGRAIRRHWKLQDALWDTEDRLRASEERNLALEEANEGLMRAISQLSDAGTMVLKAKAEGRLTTSEPPSTGPATSRRRSTGSRPMRKRGPLEIP